MYPKRQALKKLFSPGTHLGEDGYTLDAVIITAILVLATVGVGALIFNAIADEADDVEESVSEVDELVNIEDFFETTTSTTIAQTTTSTTIALCDASNPDRPLYCDNPCDASNPSRPIYCDNPCDVSNPDRPLYCDNPCDASNPSRPIYCDTPCDISNPIRPVFCTASARPPAAPEFTTGSIIYTSIDTGHVHTCAIVDDGDDDPTDGGDAYCWGDNIEGALGIERTGSDGRVISDKRINNFPIQVRAPEGQTGSLTGVVSIRGGQFHTCAIVDDGDGDPTDGGDAYCWGRNAESQLGIGTNTRIREFPTRVVKTPAVEDDPDTDDDETAPVEYLTGVTDISAGYDHTCAIVDDGDGDPTDGGNAYCWGSAGGSFGTGQLGIGIGSGQRNTPTQVIETLAVVNNLGFVTTPVEYLTGVTEISTGWFFTCAIVDDGDGDPTDGGNAYCWGDGRLLPTQIEALPGGQSGFLTGVTGISAGSNHACAIAETDGSMYCWRSSTFSYYRVLGLGGVGFLTGVTGIVAGDNVACVIIDHDDYSVYCLALWTPSNFPSRLIKTPAVVDDPDTADIDETVPVEYFTGVSHIARDGGGGHACAIKEGSAYCWGGGESGQLGVGADT